MKTTGQFDKAAFAVYMAAGIPGPTLKRWADKGLIPCRKDSNGRYLYSEESVKRATELHARRVTEGAKGFSSPATA
jgi:predicted site-specific integrase-resolvase